MWSRIRQAFSSPRLRSTPRLTKLTLNSCEERALPSAVFSLDGDHSVTEGGVMSFTITPVGHNGRGANVSYTVTRNSGRGTDYAGPTGGVLKFPAGNNAPRTLTFRTFDDKTDEDTESFTVTLTRVSHGGIGNASATGTIFDNDDMPFVGLGVGRTSVSEAGGQVVLGLKLSHPSEKTVTVGYNVESASQYSYMGVDFMPQYTGTITLAPLVTTWRSPIIIFNDRTVEDKEKFNVTYVGITNAEPTSAMWGVDIIDNDKAQFILTPSAMAISEGDDSTGIDFTIVLLSVLEKNIEVGYRTVARTATSGADFSGGNGAVVFTPRTTSQSFSVNIIGDTVKESLYESFTVGLLASGQYALGAQRTSLVTIIDDDM